jgi:hypothetical protein
MTLELTLVPAYGRDYPTAAAVVAAWKAGNDFKVTTVLSPYRGRYTSIDDLSSFPGDCVKIRFNQLADFVLIRKDGTVVADDEGDES